jgi:hypothetical protein
LEIPYKLDMEDSKLRRLKRKRSMKRGKATCFATLITESTASTPFDDYEYYPDWLRETLDQLVSLDNDIQYLLEDSEYTADVSKSEEYIDSAKRAILKAKREIENRLDSTGEKVNPAEELSTSTTLWPPLTHLIKLPPIKLEPFAGDVETWSQFWEQFESSIDKDPTLPAIHKHLFLRGYLEGEPKMLVDGIAMTANTYEETKKILHARYSNKNRIIQAHLDYLEIKPIQFPSVEALNTTYTECNHRIQALRALGEDVNGYGRVQAPKILCAFPDDICRHWIIHVKCEGHSEGDIVKLMDFLG